MMLKTTLFFLFGCSLYFGQSISSTGTISNQNNPSCSNCPINLNTAEGDGTRATNNSGSGSGTTSNEVNLITDQVGNQLKVQLMPQWRNFTTFVIYDLSGNVKKDQQIHPTNAYSIDISDLPSGNYLIEAEVVSPPITITQYFTKQ